MSHNLNLASITRRICAILIEEILTELFSAAFVLGILAIINSSDVMFDLYAFIFGYYAVKIFLDLLNNILLSLVTNGKSIGKALVNIRIAKLDETKLGFLDLILRWIVFNGLTFILGWIGLLINYIYLTKQELKQGLHDSAAKTVVINSKTSTKKKITLIASLISLSIVSIIIIVVASLSLLIKIGSEQLELEATETTKAEEYESLSGAEGTIASVSEEGSFTKGYIEYQQALNYYSVEDYNKAIVKIDEAFNKNPYETLVTIYRCYIHSEFTNYNEAYKICSDAYKRAPQNPYVITYVIYNAYLSDNCEDVNKLSIELSNMRFGKDYDNESLSYYYGTSGVYLALCEMNPDLGKKMLSEAVGLTSLEDDKSYYEGFIDSYKEAI